MANQRLSIQLLHDILILMDEEPGPVVHAYYAIMDGAPQELIDAHARVVRAWCQMMKAEYEPLSDSTETPENLFELGHLIQPRIPRN